MTNAEIELICGAITGVGMLVGGAVHLFGRSAIKTLNDVKGAVDDTKLALNRNTDATLKFVEVGARLESKLDRTHEAAADAAETVERIADEISGVHRAADPFEMRTPPGGNYAFHRPRTKGDR